MAVNPDLRNQHTTIDTKRAKNRRVAKCQRCGISLGRKRKYCPACSDYIHTVFIEKCAQIRRAKKRNAAPETAKEDAP